MSKRIIITLITLFAVLNSFKANAFEAANPYWMALKPKLKTYLEKTIDKRKYSYTIYGPSRDLKSFLGKSKNVELRFSNLNLQSPSMRKTVIASAYDNSGKKLETLPIYIDVKIYKEVLTLKKPVNKGEEISPGNIQKTVIAIDPRNARTYFDPNQKLAQKVANRNMAAGAAIRFNQVRHEKLIHVGDSIKVANKNKIIVLEFMCRAMKSGDIGDVITVSCPDLQSKSKKARIVDEAHAEFV